jgi:hypothetical protein
MRSLGVLVASLFLSCATAPRLTVLPALTPVDPGRPYLIYPAVQGTACGEGAEVRAFDDLFRLSGVDGFVTAVVAQEAKKGGCVTVTAHPITYGCTPKAFGPGATGAPLQVLPGPTACAGTALDTCTPDCTSYASRLGGSEFETSAFKNRCLMRCKGNDAAFMTCARAAANAADVRHCDAQENH